ncbi:MAG: hypothetical protein ACRD7E_16080, partial [Bryobacteraceae bacterium]
VERAITNAKGVFEFDLLNPDIYSLRVRLASFVPALKRNISVQPGVRSVLAINMASVLSSIELVYSAPSSSILMSDDWKWVLRSSMNTRPALRVLPEIDISDPTGSSSSSQTSSLVFSDTHGLVQVSSGETTPFASQGMQTDLGTTFALATTLGSNQLQFSGNIGYAFDAAVPSTGFRTSFGRGELVGGPQVKLTMQQVALPSRGAPLMGSRNGNSPALRTMALTVIEKMKIADSIEIDYGVSLDSVTYLDRLNYLSPFARVSYHLGGNAYLDFGYSSGAPPVDLLNAGRDHEPHSGLQQDIAALSVLPRLSLRDGRVQVQRTQNYEVTYRFAEGSRTYSIGVYRESVSNGALTLTASPGFFAASDLLPELNSNSYVFNIGSYRRMGYTATATQMLGDNYSVTLAVGNGGVLRTDGTILESNTPSELRGLIRQGQRHWARGKVAGIVPYSGTRFSASYEWTDYKSLTPGHIYLTQSMYPETGLNVRLRQPLPHVGGFPGRLEASAELRNMLAQGYLPISASNGRKVLLTHSPRAVRGGVSFIF